MLEPSMNYLRKISIDVIICNSKFSNLETRTVWAIASSAVKNLKIQKYIYSKSPSLFYLLSKRKQASSIMTLHICWQKNEARGFVVEQSKRLHLWPCIHQCVPADLSVLLTMFIVLRQSKCFHLWHYISLNMMCLRACFI